jgi:hypothetical protein
MALAGNRDDREFEKFVLDGSGDTAIRTVATAVVGGTDVNVHDGSANAITSTASALDVNVASGTIIANIEGDYVDDSAFTVASDKGLIVGGVFTTDQIDSGDFGAFKINADRELGVFVGESLPTGTNSIGDIANITNVVSVDDGGGSLTVDGTVAATQSGTWDINDISGTISLPTGAATESTLSSIDTDTSTIATKVTDIETNTDSLAGLTSTVVGADTALDVNVVQGINVEVDLDAADDSVLVYGFDGASNQKIKTDASGNIQVDVLTQPALASGTDSIDAVQSGTWNIGTLTSITSDVNIADGGNSITVDDGGSSLTVDGTVAATQSGTWTISRVGQIALNTDTGTGNISVQINLGTTLKILGVKIHFAGVPTANDFVVTSNNLAGGSAYDTVLYKADPGTLGVTDLNFVPAGELIIEAGEAVTITFTNAGATLYGLTTTYELIT